MPQQHLLGQDVPTYRGVTITTRDLTPDLEGAWEIRVWVESMDGSLYTLWAERWNGYMLDFFTTLHSEVAAGFMFGTVGDIVKACKDTHKAARKHARTHDRLGS